MLDDDRPTPRIWPAQPDPTANGARPRIRTPPRGVAIDHDEGDSQDAPPTDLLEARVRLEVAHVFRRLGRLVWAAIVAAGGALLAVITKMLDAREQTGVEKQRLHYLEQELRYLRSRVDRTPISLRVDEQPDLAPRPAALSPPATKGTEP